MVRTRTLTIERNEKKMDVLSDHYSEVTPLENKLLDQFESVAARQPSSFWERWAEVKTKQLNEFRVQAYALIQLNQYGAEALTSSVEVGSRDSAVAFVTQTYQKVKELLARHESDSNVAPEWPAELYLAVESLAYAWWRLNLTPDDLAELILMRDQTVAEEDKPLVYPGLKEASGWLVPPNTKTVSQQLDARCKLVRDLNDTLQLDNTEAAEFFAITEPALVEQFVKEGK